MGNEKLLLEVLEQVVRPYGMLDIAVANAKGEMVDEMLALSRQIRAALRAAATSARQGENHVR